MRRKVASHSRAVWADSVHMWEALA